MEGEWDGERAGLVTRKERELGRGWVLGHLQKGKGGRGGGVPQREDYG